MWYAVVSFDFGGNSDVNMHFCGRTHEAADGMYEKVCARVRPYNDRYGGPGGAEVLVELVALEENDGHGNFASETGATLFWSRKDAAEGARVLRSTNRE